jgi:hypothetical protein
MSLTWLIILTVILTVLAVISVKLQRSDSRSMIAGGGKAGAGRKVPEPARKINRFSAVSISSYEAACPAVKELEGTRFLSREAPLLPLGDCTSSRCHCKYTHHGDRRAGYERREWLNLGGMLGISADEQNCRSKYPRRQVDRLYDSGGDDNVKFL